MGKSKILYILAVLLLFFVILEFVIIILQRNQLQKEIETVSDVIIKDLRYGDSFNAIPVVDAKGNEATFK